MKFSQTTKFTLLFVALFSLAACSSTSQEAATEAAETESSNNAAVKTSQERAAEAASRAAAEEKRLAQAAINTKVFYFDFDVSEFRPADRKVLGFHAKDLAANSRKRIRLEGHADERGTREYNLALGERRAEAIQNYLIVNGASRSQIEIVSYGEERPAERGSNDRAYQQNRRVQIVTP